MPNYDIKNKKIKIGLLGDSLVGKTSIRYALIKHEFDEGILATPGIEKDEYYFKIENNKELKVIIFDSSGLQRFHLISIERYRDVQGIILCFDITSRKSFDSIKNWLSLIKENLKNVIIILFGNKCDCENEREISKEEAEDFAKLNNLIYFETSAKRNINIEEGFKKIINASHNSESLKDEKNNKKVNINLTNLNKYINY